MKEVYDKIRRLLASLPKFGLSESSARQMRLTLNKYRQALDTVHYSPQNNKVNTIGYYDEFVQFERDISIASGISSSLKARQDAFDHFVTGLYADMEDLLQVVKRMVGLEEESGNQRL